MGQKFEDKYKDNQIQELHVLCKELFPKPLQSKLPGIPQCILFRQELRAACHLPVPVHAMTLAALHAARSHSPAITRDILRSETSGTEAMFWLFVAS